MFGSMNRMSSNVLYLHMKRRKKVKMKQHRSVLTTILLLNQVCLQFKRKQERFLKALLASLNNLKRQRLL